MGLSAILAGFLFSAIFEHILNYFDDRRAQYAPQPTERLVAKLTCHSEERSGEESALLREPSCSWWLSFLPSQLPSLRILPRNVNRMIEMQQQPLAPIQKAKPEKVVIDERSPGPQHNVYETEAVIPLVHRHLGPKRRVAVHVLDVIGEGGVGVMDQRASERPNSTFLDSDVFMNRTIFEPSR